MEINQLLTEQNINIIKSETTSDSVEVLYIDKSQILETVKLLKNHFDILLSVCGVDTTDAFEVVYHFYSTETGDKTIIKSVLERNNPSVESVSSVYKTADWHERETFDLLGIEFLNHPNLTRILLPKDWIGHPLRKDYVQDDKRLAWNER